MMTLQRFAGRPETLPTVTAWYLCDLGKARGKARERPMGIG